MGPILLLVAGAAGAGIMYLLDPRMGNRRRALMRDQVTKLRNTITDRAEGLTKDMTNKAQGAVTETVRSLKSEEVSDEVLVARIRSEMGRYVSHPSTVEVTAVNGMVTLSGRVLADEMQPLVAKVESMPNVRQVDNRLQAQDEAGNIADLQGGETRTELR